VGQQDISLLFSDVGYSMSILIGDNNVKKIYVGTNEVKRVYVGTSLVYDSSPTLYSSVSIRVPDGWWLGKGEWVNIARISGHICFTGNSSTYGSWWNSHNPTLYCDYTYTTYDEFYNETTYNGTTYGEVDSSINTFLGGREFTIDARTSSSSYTNTITLAGTNFSRMYIDTIEFFYGGNRVATGYPSGFYLISLSGYTEESYYLDIPNSYSYATIKVD
jgi:hypothetical protein